MTSLYKVSTLVCKPVDKFIMTKPKGGRGKTAPYTTRQVRAPEPIISQIDRVIERYQEYISNGGDPENPPDLTDIKPVDKFSKGEDKLVNRFNANKEQIIVELEEALKLKANSGGAIKEKIRLVLSLLN